MGFDAIDWLRLISPVGLSWFFVPLVDHCFLHDIPMGSTNMKNQWDQ
jgi:hypothetical protein